MVQVYVGISELPIAQPLTCALFQEEELRDNRGEERVRSQSGAGKPSRTGWPQHVWALELKQ